MSFARPELLAAIPFLLILLALPVLLRARRLNRLADAYGDDAIGRILPADIRRFPRERLACLMAAGVAICIAAAGPGETPGRNPREAVPLDIAVVVDASMSMGATDVAPTRIARAGEVVIRLAEAVPNGGLSLIVLGDWPYTLVGPTDDPGLVAYLARSLGGALVANLASSIRVSSGDRSASLDAAINHARAALRDRPKGAGKRVILVLSDGAIPADPEAARATAESAAKDGIVIWTAGIGTAGETRLEYGGRPVFDAGGAPLMAGFDDALLRSVAEAGGGRYENVGSDRGARALISGLRALGGVSGPEDAGPERATFWLLLFAFGLLAIEGGIDAGRRIPAAWQKGRAA